MLKWVLIVIAVIIVLVVISVYFMLKGPDLSKYQSLKEPQVRSATDQKMLVVEVKGDPNVAGGKAFSALYSAYYKLKDNPKSFQLAPRARWPLALDTPKDQWIGRYGLPISNTARLPDNFKEGDPSLKIGIEEWKYGKVAEILHIGPYSEETPAIERLKKFIGDSGYKIIGDHEEEYLKGPGMFGKGDPAKYWTVIRYCVEKR